VLKLDFVSKLNHSLYVRPQPTLRIVETEFFVVAVAPQRHSSQFKLLVETEDLVWLQLNALADVEKLSYGL
jgi:hypothetical protein